MKKFKEFLDEQSHAVKIFASHPETHQHDAEKIVTVHGKMTPEDAISKAKEQFGKQFRHYKVNQSKGEYLNRVT